MRRFLRPAILVLLAAGCCVVTASAVPRTMLLETFTNTSCGPCASNNPVVHQFLTAYGSALAVGVQYHVNWPSATDPFYLLTPTEATVRKTYYGVNAIPKNLADGATTATADSGALATSASDRLLTDSPFTLSVQHSVVGGQVNVTVTVNAVGTVPVGSMTLQTALVETEVDYASPPGSNGETVFYNSMRRLLPDANGTSLVIAHGEQKVFNLSTPVVGAWNTANLRAVAWVQLDATKEALQAGSSFARPAYACFFGMRQPADVVALGTMKSFSSLLINAGTSTDTYDIHIARSLPAGWSGSVRVGSTSYPPWATDITAPLGAGAMDTVLVDVTPLATSGTGTMTLTVTSQGDPTRSWTRTYRAISSGLSVLCVDADGGHDFETWYTAVLDSVVYGYATWDRAALGKLSATQLANFPAVVWNADLAYPPVTSDDMAALGTYLDNGGRLFISGQDVGWALCDLSSPYRTTQSQAWYSQYLGADYLSDDAGIYTLYGRAADPIGAGLSFTISGGTGSGLQDFPDEISPRTGAYAVLYYAAGNMGAIRYQSGPFKVVYLSYGFQAQATAASRKTLMSRALQWLGVTALVDVPDPGGAIPCAALAPRAKPNPFGSATRISFVVAGPLPVSVAVYDVSGRRLRTLWDGPSVPGARSLVWDGRDERGSRAASGVYLARVRVGGEQRTLKLVLTE
jgi:hypothetical protein